MVWESRGDHSTEIDHLEEPEAPREIDLAAPALEARYPPQIAMCLGDLPGVDRVVPIDTGGTDPVTATGDAANVHAAQLDATLPAVARPAAALPVRLHPEKIAATALVHHVEIGTGIETEIGLASVSGNETTETVIEIATVSANERGPETETAIEKGNATGLETEMTYGRISPVSKIVHSCLTNLPQ